MPLTWQNVSAPNFSGANILTAHSSEQIVDAGDRLRGLAQEQADTRKATSEADYKNQLLKLAMDPNQDEKSLMGSSLKLGADLGVDPNKTTSFTQNAINMRKQAASLTANQQQELADLQVNAARQKQIADETKQANLASWDAEHNYSEGSGLLGQWSEGANPQEIIGEAIAKTMQEKDSTGYLAGPKGGAALQDWKDEFLQENSEGNPDLAIALAMGMQGRIPFGDFWDDDAGFDTDALSKEVFRLNDQIKEERANIGRRQEYSIKLDQSLYGKNSDFGKSMRLANSYQGETAQKNINTVFNAQ